MTLKAGTHMIGPATGALHLTTTREGAAAGMGHDLLVEMKRWSGCITVTGDGPAGDGSAGDGSAGDGSAGASVRVEVDMNSFDVLSGNGGITPLGAADRQVITRTALRLLDIAAYPLATFDSTAVAAADSGGTIEGALTVRGTSAPTVVEVVKTGPATWRGTATVLQSDYGIKPYRALFGALKLADPVGIEVSVDLSGC